MKPPFVIAGRLRREYLLPPQGQPLLDSPGGNLLYAAGGLAVWENDVGLLGRVGEDYPQQWLSRFEQYGLDTRGIRILPQPLDLRFFLAYTEDYRPSYTNPVGHFARRSLTFPKSLLGYQAPTERTDNRAPSPDSPRVADIPDDYLHAKAVHLCPLDFITHHHLLLAFHQKTSPAVTLDPSPGYMQPNFLSDLRLLLDGLAAFLPSEEELRSLFWGQTNDLWEMMEALGEYGCPVIVVKRGGRGQWLYDATGKRRWEIPAYPARMADPTGAGDAFCGGFLAGLHRTGDPLQAALYGNVTASLKCEGSGPFYPLDVLGGLAQARLEALQGLVHPA